MDWVEVQGSTVDVAVAAALKELQLSSPDEVTIEVLQEPKSGFLGVGSQDALVKVTPKPQQKPRRRRRRRSSNRSDKAPNQQKQQKQQKSSAGKGKGKGGGGSKTRGRSQKASAKNSTEQRKGSGNNGGAKPSTAAPKESRVDEASERSVTVEEQAEVASEFLEGLLDAFGLEGEVTTKVEDEILFIDVSGDQTEALVGAKGAIMQSVLELTRTVIQRKTFGAPRMRMDIAGYAERRREALRIYTGKLVEKVLADKGEIMLEPMNPADRKVIHDAVAEHDGVRSFSEGEDPHRSVVIAPDGD